MAERKDMVAEQRSNNNTLNMVYLIQTLKYISEKEPITLKELSTKCDFCSIYTIRNLLDVLYQKTYTRNNMFDFRLIKYIKDKSTGEFIPWNNEYINAGETYYYKIEFNTKKSEIKLLTDALAMFPFLSADQTIKLIKSIEQICMIPNISEFRKLMNEYDYKAQDNKGLRHIYSSNEFFKIIEAISEAMKLGKCIKFDYCMYASNPEKTQLVFAKRSQKVFHPAFFMWSNGFYYLVGKEDERLDKDFSNLRVDRIKNVEICKNLDIGDLEHVNPAKYRDENPVMYGGDVETITFRVRESLLNAVVDSFGKSLKINPTDYTDKDEEEYVIITTNSTIDGAAMWLTEYCSYATALSPQKLVEKVMKTLMTGLEAYRQRD